MIIKIVEDVEDEFRERDILWKQCKEYKKLLSIYKDMSEGQEIHDKDFAFVLKSERGFVTKYKEQYNHYYMIYHKSGKLVDLGIEGKGKVLYSYGSPLETPEDYDAVFKKLGEIKESKINISELDLEPIKENADDIALIKNQLKQPTTQKEFFNLLTKHHIPFLPLVEPFGSTISWTYYFLYPKELGITSSQMRTYMPNEVYGIMRVYANEESNILDLFKRENLDKSYWVCFNPGRNGQVASSSNLI